MKHDTQHFNTEHNERESNGTKYSVIMLPVTYAECQNKPFKLIVVMLNVVMLSVAMLNDAAPVFKFKLGRFCYECNCTA